MTPWIGFLNLSMDIPGAASLKDRRQVMRSLSDRLRKHFNVSCADLGPDGLWNRAGIAVVFASSSHQEAATRAGQCLEFLNRAEGEGEFVILDIKHEVFAYGDF
ncbi:MAG: DUF503 domain-containing protein [Synergistaceae bacterium]|jgi:uncharacterized protein YlxP (DUF503 family)|nr:DUF503 domain-containing protein [Synergistaceae bacterium]